MKQNPLLVLLLTCCTFAVQAQNLSKTMTFAGEARSYRLHIPASYDSTHPVPLVMALHGLGDNASDFQVIGFNQIADTANFIVVYPNALPDPLLQSSGWNTGIHPLNQRDDVGFLNAMLDTIMSKYAIDSNRVYSCGFSLGGFMTYRMACESGERFAAVASVAGSLPAPSVANCYPGKTMPVLHIHGTSDQVIPYAFGNIYAVVTNLGADSTAHYWAQHNTCNGAATHDSLPDTKNDGFTFEKYSYNPCSDESEVILIKVNGMDHEWPFTSNDIYATKEIWDFFSRHSKVIVEDTTTVEDTTGTGIIEINKNLSIARSSADQNDFMITNHAGKMKIIVTDAAGKDVYHAETAEPSFNLTLNNLESGIYLVTLMNKDSRITEKFFIRN